MQLDTFDVLPFPDLSGFQAASSSKRRLRVCIVTEEIFGPVRNGGISSTYMYLAKMLAKQGHDVSVLYLKGQRSEDHTIQYWIDWYAKDDVTLVPLPDYPYDASVGLWQRRHYSAYRWLREQPDFDVVHTSEWRGGCYYALLAKRQGLAFGNTLFLMKTSSPHIWNRHYQMQFLTDAAALDVMYPEQACVELADIVIGGSAHLLRFMEHTGYTLPKGRVFVQPNVIELAHLNIKDKRPPMEVGDTVECDELAFFGRLETRKGLEVFCEALDYLVARGVKPSKVSFLGKTGALFSHPDLSSNQLIEMRAKNWPFPVEIHMNFDQLQVISYLTEKTRIAVMPSLIENSTMAVYEALIYKIPFVASNAGGTPELVAEEHRAETLVPATPRDLANGLERVLREGARVARCSFDNDRNLEIWRGFHEFLAEAFADRTATEIRGLLSYDGAGDSAPKAPVRLSVCLLHRGDASLAAEAIEALAGSAVEEKPDEIVVAVHEHGETTPEFRALSEAISAPDGVTLVFVGANELSLGEAYNRAASKATGEGLVFMRSDIHQPHSALARTFRSAFMSSDASVFTCMYDSVGGEGQARSHRVPLGADLASGFFDPAKLGGSAVGVRREYLAGSPGFAEIFGVAGVEHNLVLSALNEGARVEIIPETLYTERPYRGTLALNTTSAQFLATKDVMQSADYGLRRIMLFAGSGLFGGSRTKKEVGPDPALTAFAGVYDGHVLASFQLGDDDTDGLSVEALLDGRKFWTGKTSDPNFHFTEEHQSNGVSIPLSAVPLRPGERGTVEIRAVGRPLSVTGTVFIPKDPDFSKHYRGVCEPRDRTEVRGWVAPRKSGNDRLAVSVYCDGRFFRTISANRLRKDKAGGGPGDFGFFCYVQSRFLKQMQTQRVDVVVAESGIPVQHSPLLMCNGQMRLTAGTRRVGDVAGKLLGSGPAGKARKAKAKALLRGVSRFRG